MNEQLRFPQIESPKAKRTRKYIEGSKEPCPTCGVKTVEWKKAICSTAVASLIKLVTLYRGIPLHLDKFTVLKKDRNFSQLRLWGLIEPAWNTDHKSRSAGKWSPTDKGTAFVNNQAKVQRFVVTWDNHFIRFEGPQINVMESLNRRFDYAELLKVNILNG